MAAELATGYVSLVPSARGFRAAVESEIGNDLVQAGERAGDDTAKSFSSRFSSGLKTAAKVGAVAFGTALGATLAVGKQAIDSASNLAESQSKVNVVFGDGAGAVTAWSETAANAFGESQQQALEAAGTFGNLFQAFGIGQQPAQQMSQSLVELAADLASFNNTSVDEALTALQSGLSGEAEPMRRFGASLSDVRLKDEAMRLGLIASTKEALTPAAKAQAAYSLIIKDTTLAQGDFARTSDGLANQQRIAAAQFENLKAQIGTALIPVMLKLITVANQVVEVIKQNWPQIEETARNVIGAIASAWAAVGQPTVDAIVAAYTFVADWVREHWTQIRDITSGILEQVHEIVRGVTSAIEALWRTFGDQIVQVITAAWALIQGVFQGAFTFINGVVRGGMEVIHGIIQTVMSLIHGDWSGAWEGIRRVISGVWTSISGIVSGALQNIQAVIQFAWSFISAITSAAWQVIGGIIRGTWEAIVGVVSGAAGAIASFLAGAWNTIAGGVASAWGAIAGIFATVWNGIVGVVSSAVHSVSSFIGSMIAPIQSVISTIQSLIGWIGRIPSSIPGLGLIKSAAGLIPGLASGGPVRQTGWHVVGEQGPEVLWLNRGMYVQAHDDVRPPAGSGGSVTAIVQHYGETVTPDTVARGIRLARVS